MNIKTERLFIRELLPTDWENLKNISEDFRKSIYVDYDIPLPVADKEMKPLCQQFAKSGLWFAVLLDEIMIGYICFHDNNADYDLGFCFHSDYHGKGYAYESCTAVMDHIAKERKIGRFTAGTALKNKPSCRLLEKLGFLLQGTEMLSFHDDIAFEGGQFMKHSDTTIRLATEADAEAIGTVHHQSWMETYTGLLPDSFLATRSPEKSTAMFLANQCRDTVVAEVKGKIVGFCGWGAFRDNCRNGGMGEINGIYLLNEYKRMRLGQRMMEYAIAQLKASGYEKVGLWVLSDNMGAIRFYEKQGFRHSGIYKEADLGETVSELLYTKEIG